MSRPLRPLDPFPAAPPPPSNVLPLRTNVGDAPLPVRWGAATARERGPLVSGPEAARNALGTPAGAFAPYRALALATGRLDPRHRPDHAGTESVVPIGPFPAWSRPGAIETLDPFGHVAATAFAPEIARGLRIRPTIAVAKGELRMGEIAEALRERRLRADGAVLTAAGAIRVTKIAIEPAWHLPGVARRLGIAEADLRAALAAECRSPEIAERTDLSVFLPPIGGASVYLFGDPAKLGDPAAHVTARLHDECNGSDVFGSDLCTCRPYLAHGVEECARGAQAGGIGVLVYHRKEGRALGEVVKYLVYNARPRVGTGDRPENYFDRTRAVAGVEDMRFQSLGTDPFRWLGVARIDRWVSMSDTKSEAVRAAGIAIGEQVAIPDALVPAHAHVEIAAKRAAGYYPG